jgi:inorganic pyrophosphatase
MSISRALPFGATALSFASIQRVDDLGKQFARELEQFFVNYHALPGGKYRTLASKGLSYACKCIKKGRSALNRK